MNLKDHYCCSIKFEFYGNFLEATQLENEINHSENNKLDVDSLKEKHKVLIKNKY